MNHVVEGAYFGQAAAMNCHLNAMFQEFELLNLGLHGSQPLGNWN